MLTYHGAPAGARWNSIIASLFPSFTMLAVFCVVLPNGIFIEQNTYVRYFGMALLAWTVVPGAAFCSGRCPYWGE